MTSAWIYDCVKRWLLNLCDKCLDIWLCKKVLLNLSDKCLDIWLCWKEAFELMWQVNSNPYISTVLPVLTVVSVPTARGHLTAPVTVLGMMAICVKTVSENIRGSRKFFSEGVRLFYVFFFFFFFFFLLLFLGRERGSKYHYKRAIIGPPAERLLLLWHKLL